MSDAETDIEILEQVLDRRIALRSLSALSSLLRRQASAPLSSSDLASTAIGLDSSVLLRLARQDPQTVDLFDHLATKHSAPLVLPGQVVQEFWNNMKAVVDTVGQSLRKRFLDLKKDVDRMNIDSDFEERFLSVLSEFEDQYGFAYDSRTVDNFARVFEMLTGKARLAYVPRARFHHLVSVRNSTKTPPGFKDSGDGDFYVWADFLLGLLGARRDSVPFDRVVLLTEDVKKDWSSGGLAHPVLVAEVEALLGVPFETWTVADFNRNLGTG